MADAVELLFKFDTQGAPALDEVAKIVEQLGQKATLTGGQINLVEQSLTQLIKTGSTTGEALKIIAGASSSLGASAANAAKGLLEEASAATTAAGAANKAAAESHLASLSIDSVGVAAGKSVPQLIAASAALRGIDGAMNVRAAERFITTITGLGPLLQAVFPLFGAAALIDYLGVAVDKVGELYNKWDPVVRAEQAALAALKESTAEYEKLNREAQKYSDDAFKRTHGEAAFLKLQADRDSQDARYGDGSNFGNAGSIPALKANIAKIDATLKYIEDNGFVNTSPYIDSDVPRVTLARTPGKDDPLKTTLGGQDNVSETNPQVLGANRAAFQAELDVAQERQLVSTKKAADDSAHAAETLASKSLESARRVEAIEKQIEAIKERSLALADKAELGTGPLADIEERRRAENRRYATEQADLAASQRENQLAGPAQGGPDPAVSKKLNELGATQAAAHTQNLSSLFAERLAAVQKAAEEYADAAFKAVQDISEYTENAATESVKKLDKLVDDAHKAGIKQREEVNKVAELGDKTDESTIQLQFRKTGRLTELAAPVGSTQSGLQEAQQAYQQQISLAQAIDAIEQRRIDREAALSALKGESYDKDLAVAEALDKLARDTGQAKVELALKVAEIERKRLEDARNEAGKVFDALVGGQKSIEGLAKNFALSQGKAVFENLTQGLFASGSGALHSLVSPGSPLASALTGTVFEPNGGNTPIDKNTTALEALTDMLARISGVGKAGVTGPLAGSLPFGTGSVASLAAAALGLGPIAPLGGNSYTDLPLNTGNDSALALAGIPGLYPNYAQEASDAGLTSGGGIGLGGDIGIAGALAGAGFGLYSGIQQGGVRGAATDVGSVGAATAAIGAILGDAGKMIPIVGSLLAIAAPLIGALLPNPKTEFANDQANTLNNDRYTMPLSIQGTFDEATGSNAVTSGYRGGTTVVLQNNTTVQVNALDYGSLASRQDDLAKVIGDATRAGNPDMQIAISRAVWGPTAG